MVEFGVRHLMITTVKGQFSGISGTITGNPDEDFAGGSVDVTIETATINTRDEKRDEHLRSADFFESDKFPHMTFRSDDIKKTGDNKYEVTGDLTIRDVTKPVTLDATFGGRATDPWGTEKIAFAAETKIDRKEFGLEWNAPLETGGVLVGNEVTITLEVQADKTS